MAITFNEADSYLLTSESVTEGHPDKLCDQISDAVLDAILANDPMARVACETCVTNGLVMVMGEITTSSYIDIASIARRTIRDAGYRDSSYGFDYSSCGVAIAVHEQSHDISQGVTSSIEVRDSASSEDEVESLGAGDQGMMVGFASNETDELMPLPIYLAHKLCLRLSEVRKEGYLPYLRPDGKSQVTVEYSHGKAKRIDTVVISTQHNPEVSQSVIERDMIQDVIREVVPAELLDANTRFVINPSGRFVIGGPVGDSGLTGRKIIVDTYGGVARHGGGAFSGKDPTKVDRSASYAARWVAKNCVAAGLADRLEIQLSYAIGMAEPTSISIETFDTNHIDDDKIVALIRKHFDLRPGAIIRDLNLRTPIYKQTAAYGHFGRNDLNLPWEKTSRAADMRREAFVGEAGDSQAASS